jgi:hypothetical protein
MFITHTLYFIINVPVVVLNTSFQGFVISFGLCNKPCDLASTISEPQFRFLSPRPHEKLRVLPCWQHRRLVLQHEAVGFPVACCAYEFVRDSFVILYSCIRYCQQQCRVQFVLSLCAVGVEGASSHRKPRSAGNSESFFPTWFNLPCFMEEWSALNSRLAQASHTTKLPYSGTRQNGHCISTLTFAVVQGMWLGKHLCVMCTYLGFSLLQRRWWRVHFLEYDAVEMDTYVPTISECLLPPSLLFFGFPEDGGSKSLRTLVPVFQSTLHHFPIEWILFKIIHIIMYVVQ